jgi:hypothetical protein
MREQVQAQAHEIRAEYRLSKRAVALTHDGGATPFVTHAYSVIAAT